MKRTDRSIRVANRHPALRVSARQVARAVRILDDHHTALRAGPTVPADEHELSVVFLTDSALAQLHADFLDDGRPTDVITFPGRPELEGGGEICVSADAARRWTGGKTAGFAHELTLYLVHGWLHLAGHDDLKPVLKRAMRRAETRALRILEEAGALPEFRLARGSR